MAAIWAKEVKNIMIVGDFSRVPTHTTRTTLDDLLGRMACVAYVSDTVASLIPISKTPALQLLTLRSGH